MTKSNDDSVSAEIQEKVVYFLEHDIRAAHDIFLHKEYSKENPEYKWALCAKDFCEIFDIDENSVNPSFQDILELATIEHCVTYNSETFISWQGIEYILFDLKYYKTNINNAILTEFKYWFNIGLYEKLTNKISKYRYCDDDNSSQEITSSTKELVNKINKAQNERNEAGKVPIRLEIEDIEKLLSILIEKI